MKICGLLVYWVIALLFFIIKYQMSLFGENVTHEKAPFSNDKNEEKCSKARRPKRPIPKCVPHPLELTHSNMSNILLALL